MIASLVVVSLLGIAFILLRPRKARFVRRVTRSRNGRPYGIEREQY